MFSFFKDRREQLALMAGFEEAAAIASWVLVTLIEQNENFFLEHEIELELVKDALDRGLGYSEQGNHRVAHIMFMGYIDRAIENHKELILAHQNLVDAVKRIRGIEKNTLAPLWEKHQHKLIKV